MFSQKSVIATLRSYYIIHRLHLGTFQSSDSEEMKVLLGDHEPYQNEPTAIENGLSPAVLVSRYEREMPIGIW